MLKYIKSFFMRNKEEFGVSIRASSATMGIGNIQSEGHGSFRGIRM